MSNKFVLLLLLFSTVLISGCIFDKEKATNSNFIPQTNLPSGYTYMGTHEVSIDIGNLSLSAVEGVYRYNGNDLYIQAINNDNPNALIAEYKLIYKDANYDPFENVTVNGHTALKVTDYAIINGQQKPKYTVLWSTGKFMIIVGPSTDSNSVMALATVTGS
jgi:hypothetical protein